MTEPPVTGSPVSGPPCRISPLGSGACLLDAAGQAFDDRLQQRIWAAARDAISTEGVLESVPGMNNLMLVFDPMRISAAAAAQALQAAWDRTVPAAIAGRDVDIPVVYGGTGGEDLDEWADRTGLSAEEVVHRHAAARYTVAAVGAMPGFPYLSGLDPALAWARRPSPRAVVAEGAVIIGGAQAGIMPCRAPSGWHIIGQTSVKLFDIRAADPVLLKPGDTVRFVVAGLEP